MLRKAILTMILGALIGLPTERAHAQEYWDYSVPVFSVPGRVLEVNLGNCTWQISPYSSEQVCEDWVRVQYYAPDGVLHDNWFAAPNSGYARPCVGDAITCDIRTDSYGLLHVRDWYQVRNLRITLRFAPPYQRHHVYLPWHRYGRDGWFYPRYYDPQPYHGPNVRYKPPQSQPPVIAPEERPHVMPGPRPIPHRKPRTGEQRR